MNKVKAFSFGICLIGGLVVWQAIKMRSNSDIGIEGRVFQWKQAIIVQVDVSHQKISGNVLEQLLAFWQWNSSASHSQFDYKVLRDSLLFVIENGQLDCGWIGDGYLFPFALNGQLYELNATGDKSVIPFRIDLRELTLTYDPSMTESLKLLRFDNIDSLKQLNADNGFSQIHEFDRLAFHPDRTLVVLDGANEIQLHLHCKVTKRKWIKQFEFDLVRKDQTSPFLSFLMEADNGVWTIHDERGRVESGTISSNLLVNEFGKGINDGTNRWPFPEKFKDGVLEFQRVLSNKK